uniref:Uncharacterized protein n=1 Tax=Aegilops tauschii TaxID=37682 RepID=M8D446_AEGTA
MAGKRRADLPASPHPPRKKTAFVGTPCSRPSLASLPDDLTSEILSRLPARSAARLKCVCKGWLSVVSSRCFADAHLELSRSRPRMLILPCEYSPGKKAAFSMRFYEYNGGLASKLVHSEEFPMGIGRWTQPLHCDGLILTSTGDHEIMVRNLLTREFVFLPKGSQNQEQQHRKKILYDLGRTLPNVSHAGEGLTSSCMRPGRIGFFPSSTGLGLVSTHAAESTKQRAISIRGNIASESVCRFEVLTLGTNTVWRRTVDPPYPTRAVTPAHVRGFIYWRSADLPDESNPEVFIRFSLADETFSLIPYPPCDAQPVGFIELEGELCCACFAKPYAPKLPFTARPDLLFVIADRELFRYDIGNATMKKVPVAIKDLWYYQPDRNNYLPYSGKEMVSKPLIMWRV